MTAGGIAVSSPTMKHATPESSSAVNFASRAGTLQPVGVADKEQTVGRQ